MDQKSVLLFQVFTYISLGAWTCLQVIQNFPAFWLIFWTLLIGFLPSILVAKLLSENSFTYFVITNSAAIVTITYTGLAPYDKPGLFLIPIIISLISTRWLPIVFAILLSLSGLLFFYQNDFMSKLISIIVFLLLAAMFLFMRVKVFTVSSKRIRTIEGIKAFSLAVEARDEYTDGHSKRVAKYARILAKELNNREISYEDAELCGYVHDIGKIRTPDHILNNEGKLTKEEFEIIKQHPEDGYHYLKSMGLSRLLLQGVRHHHERWDGKGYPHGLKEQEIPLIARMIAVADTFDAITTKRTYKQSKSPEFAYNEINHCSGSQFDPEMVAVFNRSYSSILAVYNQYSDEEKQKHNDVAN